MIAGMSTTVLTCSICSEPSTDICVYCTKDACTNHRCDRCKRCSDCCECDMPLSAEEVHMQPPAEVAIEAPVEPEVSIFAPEPTPPAEDVTF
jgi:hypothetical protein